jgi:2-dehydro-3-deoxyphosphogalactonate aldolase
MTIRSTSFPHASALFPYLSQVPLVAILRGIKPTEIIAIAEALYAVGFRCLEVPLNSPGALTSIELLAKIIPTDCLLGAGTVLDSDCVDSVANAGGRLIVMPHCDVQLLEHVQRLNLVSIPGVATLSEAFSAIKHGASGLKLFPAESVPPSALKNWRTVLPPESVCLPVGSIVPDKMESYFQAGANGFGLGAALYKPGMGSSEVKSNAQRFLDCL